MPQAAKPPRQKQNAREGFWKQVGSSFSSYCTGRSCRVSQDREIRTGGIVRSIMNESCHRRYFRLAGLVTLLPGNAQCTPSLSFCLHASQSFESAL